MNNSVTRRRAAIIIGFAVASGSAGAPLFAADYQPIAAANPPKMITLTGRDLTIDQVVEVARHGAKVQLSPEAKQRQADNHGLLLEAAAEGVPVYWSRAMTAAAFRRTTPATTFYSGSPPMPRSSENR